MEPFVYRRRLSGDLPMQPEETRSLTVTLPNEQHITVLWPPRHITFPSTRGFLSFDNHTPSIELGGVSTN